MIYLHVKRVVREQNNMATRNETPSGISWSDEESEDLLEFDMNEDDPMFDDIELEDDDQELDEVTLKHRSFSARRKIEIAREERLLKSLTGEYNDFDMYDFEDAGFNQAEGSSY